MKIDDDVPFDIQDRTFRFAILVARLCQSLCGAQDVRRILGRQLLQAATSIGANMEEADAGQTKPDFIARVAIARKEAKETLYWLRLIAATDPAGKTAVPPLLEEARQITSIVTAIRRKAEASANRGNPNV